MPNRIVTAGIIMLACGMAHAQTADVPRHAPETSSERARSIRPPAITYHLHYDGKDWGPFTLEELNQQAADKQFFIDEHVWKAGANEWKLASDYPELAFAPVYVEPEKPEEEAYHIDENGVASGPFTLAEMTARAEAGTLTADSIVWSAQAGKWVRAATLDPLKPLFPAEIVKPDEAAAQPGEAEAGAGEPAAVAKTGEPADPDAEKPEGPLAEGDQPPAPPDAEAEAPPPPSPERPVVNYFVSIGGKATGPFTEEEIKAKIGSGDITGATYLWWKGSDWTKAEKVAVFTSSFDEAPKPPPFDCTGFIAGGWERRQVIQGQTYITQTYFDANGQFNGLQGIYGYPGSNIYGTWTADAVGEKSCSITSQQQFPDMTISTAVYEIVDRMVMKETASGLAVRRIR